MTNKQINIAIAEACGWTSCQLIYGDPMGRPPNVLDQFKHLPNYCADLNAMHEAEKVAFGGTDLWQEFVFCLIETSGGGGMSELDGLCCLVQATARQRARAFLEVLGLWDNGSA